MASMVGRSRRVSSAVVGALLAAGLMASCSSSSSTTSTSAPSSSPGTIVSSKPIVGAPQGTKGWRIVYRTTTASGAPAVSAGTVYVPTTPSSTSKRFVVAWAHPTLGMGEDCTPSSKEDPSLGIPGFAAMMAAGWVVTSTDYTGLGSPGVLPYLVGSGEGRNVIDSVRAAQHLSGTDAGSTYAVWGHSQGGHASLFTADVARSYAPGLHLVGVAAAAPAAELSSLISLQWQSLVSWVIGSEVIEVWPHYYPTLSATQVATPEARANAKRLGAICITADQSALLSSFGPFVAKPFFTVDPTQSPSWRRVMDVNTPSLQRSVPSFVAQGLEDTVVLPSTTAQLERAWCAKGGKVTVAWYPTATHFSVPTLSASTAVGWMKDRFAGKPATSTCAAATPVAPAANPPAAR